MQRSSETIGAIAGALAKAQAEIANPEKSLIATIRSPRERAGFGPQKSWSARDRDRGDDLD
jgi:hypothetical protein